jgi:class 3 adenylate cyclase
MRGRTSGRRGSRDGGVDGPDYFGRTVNVAARGADNARPGEVVVSQAVVDIAEPPGIRFAEIGTVDLKGVSEALRLHVAGRL